jgi:hypothetical protein
VRCPQPVGGPFNGQTAHLGAVPAGTYPTNVSYPAGWNLLAGVDVTGTQATVDTLAADHTFVTLPLSTTLDAAGYWVYFPQPVTVPLTPRGALGTTVMLAAGQWALLGNPGQVAVTVEGADVVETYDPTTNTYAVVDRLEPGQAAWVYASAGGTVDVTPIAGQ